MERNFSIDAMKPVATFMVCFIHFKGFSVKCIEWWNGLEGSISYAFLTLCSNAVPIFLIINGYLIITVRRLDTIFIMDYTMGNI